MDAEALHRWTMDKLAEDAAAIGHWPTTILPPIPIENDDLDRAMPPQGWSSWDKFVAGEPRDVDVPVIVQGRTQ